ncbi:MAG: CotH kinase family protein [Bacteroidota bacterium]
MFDNRPVEYCSFLITISCLIGLASCQDNALSEMPPVEPPPSPVVEECAFVELKLDGATCALSAADKIFYYPIITAQTDFSPLVEVTDGEVAIKIDGKSINNLAENDFGTIQLNRAIPIELTDCEGTTSNYQLIFTSLPILQIKTLNEAIVDEPKVAVELRFNDPNFEENEQKSREIKKIAGIEFRGGSSQFYDKKAYALEIWEDTQRSDTEDLSFLDLREDDDWILDGMSNDNLRMRNRVSMDVWRDFQPVPHQMESPKANSGTSGRLIELFIDDDYRGLYALSDRVDRKLLKLNKFEDGDDFGVLYKGEAWGKGVVRFDDYCAPNASTRNSWEGWVQQYPNPNNEAIVWTPLAELTDFVVNASDEDFVSEIADRIDLDNFISYYLYLNLIRGDDNVGKNTFLARVDSESPFFILPWDVDATWGLFWNRDKVGPRGILSNGLFERLIATNPNNFTDRLKSRWAASRQDIFSYENLMGYFNHYAQQTNDNGVFERERRRWDIAETQEEELRFVENWLQERLAYLDNYFSEI